MSARDWDFSDLRAVFVNCTLKRSPALSHTAGLIELSAELMESQGVTVDRIRAVDYDIAPGVQADMTAHGFENDDWPGLLSRILAGNILVIGTPIWLGDKSSIATRVIERLYSVSSEVNDAGQLVFYGRAGGCIVTGNEDGVKHCAMNLLYSLQHMGFATPPQADSGWIGDAGPGPSYLDDDSGGRQNDFTNRNTAFMTWNLMHLARMLSVGFPAHGNSNPAWDAGDRFGLRPVEP